jgi:hypothetical protein
MKRTYQEKLANINNFVEITNYHWDRLLGILRDDEEFWEHTFGTMTNQDWWDWVEIEPALRAQYPDEFRRFPSVKQGTEHINKCLMMGKQIYRKDVKGANFNSYLAWMNIKDVMNEINGTPTKVYTDKDRKKGPEDDDPTQFQKLFDIE